MAEVKLVSKKLSGRRRTNKLSKGWNEKAEGSLIAKRNQKEKHKPNTPGSQ